MKKRLTVSLLFEIYSSEEGGEKERSKKKGEGGKRDQKVAFLKRIMAISAQKKQRGERSTKSGREGGKKGKEGGDKDRVDPSRIDTILEVDTHSEKTAKGRGGEGSEEKRRKKGRKEGGKKAH